MHWLKGENVFFYVTCIFKRGRNHIDGVCTIFDRTTNSSIYTDNQGFRIVGLRVRELTQFMYSVCTVFIVSFGHVSLHRTLCITS